MIARPYVISKDQGVLGPVLLICGHTNEARKTGKKTALWELFIALNGNLL